jgi:Mg2+ and Co2+ transporter CorA
VNERDTLTWVVVLVLLALVLLALAWMRQR